MMRQNLPHYYEAPVQDNRSPRRRSPSRKERSPTWHGISHRGNSRPIEKYSFHPRSLKHARSPSPPPYYPFPQTKRLRRAEAGTLPARVHERFNGRWIGRELQQDVYDREIRSHRKEKLSGWDYTDDRFSRSRHRSSPSDRDLRSGHRHPPQHAGDIRYEKNVNEGRDKNHSRGNDRSMHTEYETESLERTKAKDSTSHMSSTSRHDTYSSDRHHSSRRRSYSPQHSYDTRYDEKVIEGHERNPSRGHRRMHIEKDTERVERLIAEESSSQRSSRSGHFTSPSNSHGRSRHTYYSLQHAADTRDEEEKVIEGHQRSYRRESDRSIHREKRLDRQNETDRMERRIAKDNSGLRSSKSVHGQSNSPLNGHNNRHRTHSSQPDGDTKALNEVPESREVKDGIYVNDSVAMMRAAEEILEEHKKQKPSFVLSGKLAVEANRFRGLHS